MKLNELKPAAGSRSKRLRKGRGLSSGHGFTSGDVYKRQLLDVVLRVKRLMVRHV